MTVFRPSFAGWISAWAIATFASAAIEAGWPDRFAPVAWVECVFHIADRVPPGAKIAFGATLAAVFFAIGKIRHRFILAASGMVATLAAFALSALIYPLSYYSDFATADFWPWHAVAGLLGGAAYAVTTITWRARDA